MSAAFPAALGYFLPIFLHRGVPHSPRTKTSLFRETTPRGKRNAASGRSRRILNPSVVRKLVRWYERYRRELPWRQTRDPYRIWVSEILLQQTQTETVKPYYHRFIQSFPTVFALAAAAIDEVLKVWEGCGYYSRARNLHRAAQIIVERGGELPRSAAELVTLPGIGTYTSAAIASIAFGEAVPVLDGNVERVLARMLGERRPLKSAAVLKKLRAAGEQIMQTAMMSSLKPGDINQALMELGATVCMPKRALCTTCPLKAVCRAKATLTDVTVLPRKTAARAIPHYDIGAAVIRKNGKILITQRPHDGLLGGLWEFPGGKKHANETLKACVAREIREELDIEVAVGELLISVKHAYSHFRITLHAFTCRPIAGRIKKIGVADYRWVKPNDLSRFAFPKADRVILELLNKGNNKPNQLEAEV